MARSISHITWYLRWKANDGVIFDDFDKLIQDWARAKENRNRQCQQLSAEGTFEAVKKTVMENPFLILRVEKFDESLFLFREWTGEESMDLRYVLRNTGEDRYERIQHQHPDYLTKVRDFQTLLKEDADRQEILREANQEDQAFADWVEAEIWPKQVAEYKGELDEEVAAFKKDKVNFPKPSRNPSYRDFTATWC